VSVLLGAQFGELYEREREGERALYWILSFIYVCFNNLDDDVGENVLKLKLQILLNLAVIIT